MSTKLTPAGSVPDLESEGVGAPVVVTVNEPGVPAVKVVLLALVISGACPEAVHESETCCLPCVWLRVLSKIERLPPRAPLNVVGEQRTPTLQNAPGESGDDVEQVVVLESNWKLVSTVKLVKVSG